MGANGPTGPTGLGYSGLSTYFSNSFPISGNIPFSLNESFTETAFMVGDRIRFYLILMIRLYLKG